MEFLSFDAPKKTLTLKKGPIPKPKEDEVLIKVAYSGICGTDLHILEGHFPVKESEPVTLGHEFVGTVETVGSKVKTFKAGQRVAVDPNSGCNLCTDCHSGCYHMCLNGGTNNTIGIWMNGGWAEYVVVPETQVYLVPEDINLQQAALSEPLSCLAHGWDKISPVIVGQKVLIIGAGIIGLLWANLLHLHGLRKTVTVSEPQEKRRAIVKNMGLGYNACSPQELEGQEFDVIIDCSGYGPAIESAIKMLGRGGRFIFFGVASTTTKVAIEPYQMYKKELSFHSVNINPFTFPKAISLIEAMADSYLSFEKLGIKVFKLSEHKEAVDALKKGTISKVVFKL